MGHIFLTATRAGSTALSGVIRAALPVCARALRNSFCKLPFCKLPFCKLTGKMPLSCLTDASRSVFERRDEHTKSSCSRDRQSARRFAPEPSFEGTKMLAASPALRQSPGARAERIVILMLFIEAVGGTFRPCARRLSSLAPPPESTRILFFVLLILFLISLVRGLTFRHRT
jgi:hypothetical protein